ncbi:hypothetical protein OSB04_021873 [Centaurea solstitialis]|uniref:B box-type domain-containing protein n=1 Tax=Centaurea solstitialis TaxID=347529 RepID=A0AA38SV02_9ASTR|nr:hypothetical protein OSB04_021873 [Centaurea solstitialis]
MKSCVLCKSLARIYCDSDQASLCWTCDSKVHSANFLVARHSRNLLCRVCQSPTPWTASGEKLGPSTVSVCEKCVVDGASEDDEDREESHGENDDDDDDEYDGDEDSENEIDLEDEEDGDDNQVVPLCCTPPPSASSSSSEEEFSDNNRSVLVKRKRENAADLSSEDDVDCSSVQKHRRKAAVADEIGENGAALHEASSEAIVGKLGFIRHRDKIYGQDSSEAVVDVAKATRAVGFDLNSSDSS